MVDDWCVMKKTLCVLTIAFIKNLTNNNTGLAKKDLPAVTKDYEKFINEDAPVSCTGNILNNHLMISSRFYKRDIVS